MTKTTKPRTKRLKVSKPIVTPDIDPEASADEAMVLDHAPFTDSLKRISEQAKDWEDTALSPRGPKPYERTTGRSQNFMLARLTVVLGIVLFASILGNAVYFSFQVRTLNRALTAVTQENKKLKEEVAAIALIKLAKAEQQAQAQTTEAKATKVVNAPATAPTATTSAAAPALDKFKTVTAQIKPTVAPAKPAVAQPKMAKAKSTTTAWKSDFE